MKSQHMTLKPTFVAVNDILRMENCKVHGLDGMPERNKLSVNPGRMDLEFRASYKAMQPHFSTLIDDLPELTIETARAIYKIPKYNACFEGTYRMCGDEEQHFDLRLSKLRQTTLLADKAYYWRFLYPIAHNEWFLKVVAMPYTDDFGMSHFQNLILANLDGHQMKVFTIKVDNQNWMVIESSEAISYDEMDHRVMSLTIALGFVLGKRFGDYCFHVASDEPSFSQIMGVEALSLRKTKICPFKILHCSSDTVENWLSQYERQQYALDELKAQKDGNATRFYDEDMTVTMEAFSRLSQLCYKYNDMILATSMLIDGSMMNIEYQNPFFHVVLETLTSALMKDDDAFPSSVMPKEQYKEEVIPVLEDALNGISVIGEDPLRVFRQRIEHNLNAAPNANKLESCFSKYGYTLTESDRKVIKKRNSTFHGHLSSEEKPLREQQGEMLAESFRLHKLCSILLLKAAGFTGKVINNEVLFGLRDACERRDSVYTTI